MGRNIMDNLTKALHLLRISNLLARRLSPFYCLDIECFNSGHKVLPGTCRCYDLQLDEHYRDVEKFLDGQTRTPNG